jgi:glycosyltransferase involved in cell wall biosynthesis
MRILFLTHYFPPEGNAPASRVYEMAKRWVASGHEVEVITCVPNVPNGIVYDGYRNKLKQTEFIDGIRVTRVWTFIAANKGKIKRILNYLSYHMFAIGIGLFVKRPDVVIATSPQFFCGGAGLVLAKLRRLPIIVEIRDIWPASIEAVGAMEEGFCLRCLRMLEMNLYKYADHVVTVGEGYKEDLVRKSVAEKKISVIMNGVDQTLFKPNGRAHFRRQQLNMKGKFVCSYIGTVGMACGLDVVLRAGKLLRDMGREDISFLIIGDGAMRSEFQRDAERQQLGNIVFTGLQPKAMIPSYLSMTDACLIHLKDKEIFRSVMPSKIFEAAGMAKPIIIGVPGCAERFVVNANAGIAVEPENEQELVEAVLKLADDQALSATYGRSGYQYIINGYTRDKLSRDYLQVIKQVLNGTDPLKHEEQKLEKVSVVNRKARKTMKIIDVVGAGFPRERSRSDQKGQK